MIGHYLLTLTTEQEDAVLTEKLAYAPLLITDNGCRCLLGVTKDYHMTATGRTHRPHVWLTSWDTHLGKWLCVGRYFDRLCQRFGEPRINTAIRNRILANRARRVLSAPVESAVVGSAA